MEVNRGHNLGLFAPNYDVDVNKVDVYLDWLHGEHLPRTLAEGSFSAISHYEAVEAEKQYQLLEIMPSYTSFHSEGRLEAANQLPENVADMMALRLGQVRCHYAEVSWVDGPLSSSQRPSAAIGPAVCLMRFDVNMENRPNFNAWLGREHFGEVESMEGLLTFRRYLAVEGKPANLFLYEFDSVDALFSGRIERSWSTPWAKKISQSVLQSNNSKDFYRQIWSQG